MDYHVLRPERLHCNTLAAGPLPHRLAAVYTWIIPVCGRRLLSLGTSPATSPISLAPLRILIVCITVPVSVSHGRSCLPRSFLVVLSLLPSAIIMLDFFLST
ncbi:hypothetical protein PLICRDRAFT_702378 [Plicaturopsis crispa FD-325 SS-3]|uniref:Uncharacterized protein n=1 Tax=Plicaturopsis crispa FD-325 SS-3 TaxID=944288 RepID=A0A0C9SKI8_PLICR|nr:hypothetical protein PLICRDRAFT_702378 [Plicaturopsis crispa FD-325 SS-3]